MAHRTCMMCCSPRPSCSCLGTALGGLAPAPGYVEICGVQLPRRIPARIPAPATWHHPSFQGSGPGPYEAPPGWCGRPQWSAPCRRARWGCARAGRLRSRGHQVPSIPLVLCCWMEGDCASPGSGLMLAHGCKWLVWGWSLHYQMARSPVGLGRAATRAVILCMPGARSNTRMHMCSCCQPASGF